MRKHKLFLMLIVAISLALLLSGNVLAKTTLIWWSHDNAAFVDANKKLIEEYEKLHPDIEIKLQYFPYDAFIQKLKASFAAKQPPDIAQMFGTWVTQYAKNGLLYPAPSAFEGLSNDFFDAATGAYMVDGKLYGIPHEYNLGCGGILTHPKMFEDAGVPYPPKTYDEVISAAKKLTVYDGNNIKVRGFDFISNDNINFFFYSLILQQGGSFWTDDNFIDFTTPEAVKAMQEMKDLVVKYKLTDLTLLGSNSTLASYDIFFRGSSAMTLRGPWVIALGYKTYKANDFEYIQMPSYTDKPPYFAAESGWGEVVAKYSKHPEEAWDFVKFATAHEQALPWNVTTATLPASKAVADDPAFLEQAPKMKTSLDILQYGQWIGPVEDRDFFFKQITDTFQEVVSEKVTVEQGLQNLTDSINTMLRRNR